MHQTLNFGGPQNFQPFVGPRHLPKFLVHIVFRLKKKKDSNNNNNNNNGDKR